MGAPQNARRKSGNRGGGGDDQRKSERQTQKRQRKISRDAQRETHGRSEAPQRSGERSESESGGSESAQIISATTKTRNVFSIVDVSHRSKKERLQEVLRSISHRRSIFF